MHTRLITRVNNEYILRATATADEHVGLDQKPIDSDLLSHRSISLCGVTKKLLNDVTTNR